jgi:GT2 family glycosyltransferase
VVPCIIIPVLNRYDLLERAIKSIDYPVEELLIIDNGGQSTLNDYPWIIDRRHVKNYRVWSMPTNLGVAPSWNLGIKATPHAPGWILMNSDAAFEPGQLEHFHNDTTEEAIIFTSATPGWSCVWIGAKVVEKIGLFSECYVPAYFEDNDYEQRARNNGIPILLSDAAVQHDNSSTIKASPEYAEKNMRSFQSNQALHLERWHDGTPPIGHWDITRRRELGWDA